MLDVSSTSVHISHPHAGNERTVMQPCCLSSVSSHDSSHTHNHTPHIIVMYILLFLKRHFSLLSLKCKFNFDFVKQLSNIYSTHHIKYRCNPTNACFSDVRAPKNVTFHTENDFICIWWLFWKVDFATPS